MAKQKRMFDRWPCIPYKGSAVIYCDIPYRGTNGYDGTSRVSSFDYERFYDWCRRQQHLVVVSEYRMPDDFVCIGEFQHRCTLLANGNNATVEKLFVHQAATL